MDVERAAKDWEDARVQLERLLSEREAFSDLVEQRHLRSRDTIVLIASFVMLFTAAILVFTLSDTSGLGDTVALVISLASGIVAVVTLVAKLAGDVAVNRKVERAAVELRTRLASESDIADPPHDAQER